MARRTRQRITLLKTFALLEVLDLVRHMIVLQARRIDHFRSAGPRLAHDGRQSNPRPGEPQQRLPTGMRRGDQSQPPGAGPTEARAAAERGLGEVSSLHSLFSKPQWSAS